MMNKNVLASVVLVLSSSVAYAGPAVHINEFSCGMFDGDGNFVTTNDTKTTITNNPNGNSTLQCKADVANSTGKAVRYDLDSTGSQCNTFAGSTDKWHETVSASGKATLICHTP